MFQSARHLTNGSETWQRAWDQCQRKQIQKVHGEKQGDREWTEKVWRVKGGGGNQRDRRELESFWGKISRERDLGQQGMWRREKRGKPTGKVGRSRERSNGICISERR